MLPNPYYYLMVNALEGTPIDVVCFTTDHNLNMMMNYRRVNPRITFVSMKKEEAHNFLSNNTGIGIGCYINAAEGGSVIDHRWSREKLASIKAKLFRMKLTGYHPERPVRIRLDRYKGSQRELLSLFSLRKEIQEPMARESMGTGSAGIRNR